MLEPLHEAVFVSVRGALPAGRGPRVGRRAAPAPLVLRQVGLGPHTTDVVHAWCHQHVPDAASGDVQYGGSMYRSDKYLITLGKWRVASKYIIKDGNTFPCNDLLSNKTSVSCEGKFSKIQYNVGLNLTSGSVRSGTLQNCCRNNLKK